MPIYSLASGWPAAWDGVADAMRVRAGMIGKAGR